VCRTPARPRRVLAVPPTGWAYRAAVPDPPLPLCLASQRGRDADYKKEGTSSPHACESLPLPLSAGAIRGRCGEPQVPVGHIPTRATLQLLLHLLKLIDSLIFLTESPPHRNSRARGHYRRAPPSAAPTLELWCPLAHRWANPPPQPLPRPNPPPAKPKGRIAKISIVLGPQCKARAHMWSLKTSRDLHANQFLK
jgi:hypothetical protein